MATKMLSNRVSLWWVPASTVGFNPDAPSAALLTPARNVSCAVVSGYTINPTAPDTDSTTSICNDANVETPTFKNYEGNVTFFRQSLVLADVDAASAYTRAFEFFKRPDADGYWVRRIGKKNLDAAVAGDKVAVFKFMSDNPQDVVPDDGGPIQMTVPFLPQGKLVEKVALVA